MDPNERRDVTEDLISAPGYIGPERRHNGHPRKDRLGTVLSAASIVCLVVLALVAIGLAAKSSAKDDRLDAAQRHSDEVAACGRLYAVEVGLLLQQYNDAKTERDRIATEAQALLGQGDDEGFARLSGDPLKAAFAVEDEANNRSQDAQKLYATEAEKARSDPALFLAHCALRYGPG